MVKLFESFRNEIVNLDLPDIVKWYTCGPTIYDDSHIGHARTFITYDILRRLLEFKGHHVLYAMNITDIDDKIMTKIKKIHWLNLLNSINIEYDIEKNRMDLFPQMENMEPILMKHFSEEEMTPPIELFYNFIDNEEVKFWSDMSSINVKMPFAKIRVTQVHNEIVEFIETLINKGMAYISGNGVNKSVYFDTQKYKNNFTADCTLHHENDNDMSIKNNFSSEKKHPYDFSLWKATKKYEISFSSPWGLGHVSWHTECSVMINKLFGSKIDIHSGGIDLKFPHHHNECVQTIAYTGDTEWNKYFIHTGHLHIDNEKMSKSLGNSVTIKNFLAVYNYRILRIIFINSKWNDILNFNDNVINFAADLDKRISNFYDNIIHHINLNKIKNSIDDCDVKFASSISNYRNNLNLYWDSFDTQKIILQIQKIIDDTYIYMSGYYNVSNLIQIKDLIDIQLNIMGINYNVNSNHNESTQYIDAVIDIRNMIKKCISEIPKDQKDIKNKLFTLSDWIRDNKMINIGVKIEDLKDSTKWSFI